MTIGDILAVIAAVLVVAATWGSTVLLMALLCPVKAAEAEAALRERPWKCGGRGALVLFGVGLFAFVLMQQHAGPLRIVAGALWGMLGVLAAIGSAGIARIAAERIDETGTSMMPFASLTRATALYVAAGYLPIIGWFFVAPAALLASLGAGYATLRKPRAKPTATSAIALPPPVATPSAIPSAGVMASVATGATPAAPAVMAWEQPQ